MDPLYANPWYLTIFNQGQGQGSNLCVASRIGWFGLGGWDTLENPETEFFLAIDVFKDNR